MIRVCAIGAVLAVFIGCTPIGSPTTQGPEQSYPEQELFDATIRFYQSDRVSGVLQAGRIRKYEKNSTILLDDGVEMDFFDESGKHTTWLRADSGRADEVRKDLHAFGNVVARSDSGQTLETSQLRWENRARRIVSDTRVKLMTPTDTLYGIGFVSDENLKNWTIDQPQGVTFREFERGRSDSLGADAAR